MEGGFMATIQDYTSGKVCEQINIAFSIFESSKGSLEGTRVGEAMLKTVHESEPIKLTPGKAIQLIEESQQCAVGERVCRLLHKETPLTKSVFLDDLAAGMVEAGKAKFVTKAEAIDNIKKYQKSPIIVPVYVCGIQFGLSLPI